MTDYGEVRRVSWRDLVPGVILLRLFSQALSPPILLLATAGVLLTPIGWRLGQRTVGPEERSDPAFEALVTDCSRWPADTTRGAVPDSLRDVFRTAVEPANVTFRRLTGPFRYVYSGNLTPRKVVYLGLGGVWSLLVWGLIGGTITRRITVQLGREERVSILSAARHTVRRIAHYLAAPCLPLMGVAVVAAVTAGLGWIARSDVGLVIAGGLWILVLLGAAIATFLVAGLMFGWPLMWVALAAEEDGDAFDATSRSFAYTLGAPLTYAGYLLAACVLGGAAWLIVACFLEGLLAFSELAFTWGAGSVRGGWALHASDASLGGQFIQRTNQFVRSLATGFAYAFFWAAASAVYLLLRRTVDQVEMDVVHLDEEEDLGLPPISYDHHGVPQLATGAAGAATSDVAESQAAESQAAESQAAEPAAPDSDSGAAQTTPAPNAAVRPPESSGGADAAS